MKLCRCVTIQMRIKQNKSGTPYFIAYREMVIGKEHFYSEDNE